MSVPKDRRKGRGAGLNPANRFASRHSEPVDDGWTTEERPPLRTELGVDSSRSIIAYNDSPDIPFDRSINPYRGCEHGCIYCYARPSHAWLDLSPGLDFETRLLHKPDGPELLREELRRPGYRCEPLALGANTDCYQPVEREQRLTRRLLEVLLEHRHPLVLITKGALVERDMDLLSELAKLELVQVMISITTLDRALARRLEPRAATPERRQSSIERLSNTGIPVGLLLAPVIPGLTDNELENILEQATAAGIRAARYVLLRLPREVGPLFEHWLGEHYPERREKVMNILRDCRGGELNDSRFGRRMTGQGLFADLIRQRFRRACQRLELGEMPSLRRDLYRKDPAQLTLF